MNLANGETVQNIDNIESGNTVLYGKVCGIYKVTNKVNGKFYIGQSVDIKRRWSEHRILNRDETLSLKRALRKYGVENFIFSVIEECLDYMLNEREEHYIKNLKPAYNRCKGGTGAKGHYVSDDLKEKLSVKGKQQWINLSEEGKKTRVLNLTGPRKGHPVSAETRQKLRSANIGKKQSKETIEKRNKTIIENGLQKTNEGHKKRVYCVDLKKEFESVKYAAEYLEVHPSNISSHLKGKQSSVRGHIFIRVV